MDQKDQHESEVEIRQHVTKSTRQAIGQRVQQISNVIEMAGKSPPSGSQKVGVLFLRVSSSIRRQNVPSRLPPDRTLSIRLHRNPEVIFLVVDRTEDQVAGQANEENGRTSPPGQAYWIVGQVDTLKSVHEGKPARVTPRQVEAKVVVSYVDCAQIPRFVEEEVYNIRPVQ